MWEMEICELNASCKSKMFKSILVDTMYSFRTSIKKLTSANTDIRLGQIRFTPIECKGDKVEGRIKNLVGGKITCLISSNLIKFLETNETSSIELVQDFFDVFSSVSHSSIKFNEIVSYIDRVDAMYYISFDIKVLSDNGVISSKLVLCIDEITSLYFN